LHLASAPTRPGSMLRLLRTPHRLASAPAALIVLLTAGCDQPRAHGDQNALIVAADTDFWMEVEELFRDAVEPTIQTVRNERPFRITQQEPTALREWGNLQRFRQIIAVGDLNDAWIQEALDRYRSEPPNPPALLQVQNVWARGQIVSVLLLPENGKAEALAQLAPDLRSILDEQFRSYARNRMFVSGENAALADSLLQNVGFSVTFPQVYRYSAADSVFHFRNDNPSPTELIREVVVTWQSPIPEEDPTRSELEAWRLAFTEAEYANPQNLDTLVVSYRDIEVNGLFGVEYQSAWVSPPDYWIAGGPFITRALRCPSQDRLYLMDAWLYAPGRDKYEYMIQLQTILDSFRCR